MGSFPDARSADADGFDEVRFGSSRPPGHGRPGWLLIAAGAAVVAVIAVVSVATSGHKHTPPAASAARPTVRPVPPVILPTTPVITRAGHRLLGVTAGWELFGYGSDQVVRIEFARGLIVRTPVPSLASGGPLSFVIGPGQVIIRPLDRVPGYLVPDGHPARRLTGVLSHGGTLIPGPRPGTAWYQDDFQAGSLALVRTDGTRTGTSLPLPGHGGWQVFPDGRGYALAGVSAGELYDIGPRGVRRLAGTLAAVGPASWLIMQCRDHRRCSDVVVNSATGARHTLPGRVPSPAAAPPVVGAPGVIAPDGSAAALLRAGPGGQMTLQLLNLTNGRDHRIDVTLYQGAAGIQALAWSPDSRWLFVVAANGTLAVVNARTQHIESIGVNIPPISQIAIRNSPLAHR